MYKSDAVSMDAFRDYIDTLVAEGVDQATFAATSFAAGLAPEELVDAIKYAALNDIEMIFIPDVNEYEVDYHPHRDPIEMGV